MWSNSAPTPVTQGDCKVPGCEWSPSALIWHSTSEWKIFLNCFPRKFHQINAGTAYELFSWDIWMPHKKNGSGAGASFDLCQEHHDMIVELWEEEMAYDVWFMETTDDYYARTDGTIKRGKLYPNRSRGKTQG